MYPHEADITKEQMLDLLADVHLSQLPGGNGWPRIEWRQDAHAAAAVLEIGGAVGVYVRIDAPDQLYIPTMRHGYEIGWIRSNPEKGRRIIHCDHLKNPLTGQQDEATHPIGVYRGAPFTGEEIHVSMYRWAARVDAGQKGVPIEWTRRVYGDPPPAEVTENLNARLFKQYHRWFFGPGERIARDVKCDHEYGMFDSCPGCDHQEEMGLGPWATTEEKA